MIDAYEIGIQLALQDGVSAGLEAISRDLAEVDRAIAATTAGLQGLTLAAQAASREAAAVGGFRVGAVGAAAAVAGAVMAPPEREAPVVPLRERDDAAQDAGRPVPSLAESPSAPVTPMPAAAPETVIQESAAPQASAAVAIDPAPAASAPAVMVQQLVSVVPFEAGATGAPVAPVVVEPSAAPPRPGDMEVSAIAPISFQREAAASPTGVATGDRVVTASVSKVLGMAASAGPSQRGVSSGAGHGDVTATHPAGRTEPASWVREPEQVRARSQMTGGERAAAPQPQTREGGERMSGTVVLDGRMVGYWMSDQMAREASKPPGGTTFFDPRQSPAWNASGAL